MFPSSLKEDIHRCVNCGICQHVCPTYRAIRKESYAPRGRVQIIKHYLEGKLEDRHLHKVMSTCIQCEACATFCLSGVRINRIFQNIIRDIETNQKSVFQTNFLKSILTNNSGMRLASQAGRVTQSLANLIGRPANVANIPVPRLPQFNRKSFRAAAGEIIKPQGKIIGRVAYFTGCGTEMFYEDVGHSVLHVLNKLGIEIIIPKGQVCCGMPLFSKGNWKQALVGIEKNLKLFDRDDIDAIVVDCATCGAALKHRIPELFEDLQVDNQQAIRIASKVKDVTEIIQEYIEKLPLRRFPQVSGGGARITYHDPCHLCRGMGVVTPPRQILSALQGVEFVELEEANECCGGGGRYQFDEVDLSAKITARKIGYVRESGAQILATGCPGCRTTLAGNLNEKDSIKVLHTVQLLAKCLL